jgi:hypothetical protein
MDCKREERNMYKIMAGRSFLKKPTLKTRKKTGNCEGKTWIELTQECVE